MNSEEYRNCCGLQFEDPLAGRFFRQHLILLREEKFEKAFHAILHAAWVCDYADDAENAVRCRDIVTELMELYILLAAQEEAYLLLYADVLRRAGHFDKLSAKFSDMWLDNEEYRKILAFELILAGNKDAGCYTVKDVERFFLTH